MKLANKPDYCHAVVAPCQSLRLKEKSMQEAGSISSNRGRDIRLATFLQTRSKTLLKQTYRKIQSYWLVNFILYLYKNDIAKTWYILFIVCRTACSLCRDRSSLVTYLGWSQKYLLCLYIFVFIDYYFSFRNKISPQEWENLVVAKIYWFNV